MFFAIRGNDPNFFFREIILKDMPSRENCITFPSFLIRTPEPCVAPSMRIVIALAIRAISDASFASAFDAERTIAAVDAVKVPSSIGCPIGRRDNAAATAVIRGFFKKDVLVFLV